jgi:AraC-like DNA-binding protein
MFQIFKEVDLKIPFRKIKETHVWHLDTDMPLAHEIAKPLFDIGVSGFGFAEKKNYTLFAPYKNYCHSFTLVLQGKLTVQIGKKRFTHGPGMISFCPKNEIFQRYATGPTWWIYINLLDTPLWEPLKLHGGYERRYEWTNYMLVLASSIFQEYQKQTLMGKLNALEYSRNIAELLKRELLIPLGKPDRSIGRLESLASNIRLAPGKPWNVAEMVRMTSFSRRSLTRNFRVAYGASPMEMVIRNRMESAIHQLLYTDEKIESIAYSLSYKTKEAFSKIFLRKVGMRPGEFRAKCRSERRGLPRIAKVKN